MYYYRLQINWVFLKKKNPTSATFSTQDYSLALFIQGNTAAILKLQVAIASTTPDFN
jgi:hypothetical protein